MEATTLQENETRKKLIRELMRYIKTTLPNPRPALARKTLNSYSTPLLMRLHHGATTSTVNGLNNDYTLANDGRTEDWINLYHYILEDCYSDKWKICSTPRTAVMSLSLYPMLTPETEDYYPKAAALTSVVIELQDYFANEPTNMLASSPSPENNEIYLFRITNDALVTVILNNHEKWEMIAGIMTERSTDDADLIDSIINAENSSPLVTGTL